MLRLFYALIVGIIGAGIVHIVVLMLLPQFSDRDAWSRLALASALYEPVRIDGAASALKSEDPLFVATACRFDLGQGVLHVETDGTVPFWSVSVYDRAGQNIYSFNDRTANNGLLDFVVLDTAQMIELNKAPTEELQKSILVEAPVSEGIVLIRAFVPDRSWKQAVSGFLDNVTCSLQ